MSQMTVENETSRTTPVVDQIRALVADIPGWTPEDQLFAIYMLAITTSHLEGDICEIGSWCGRSTSILALAASRSSRSVVHAVDLFPDKSDWFENPDGTFSFRVKLGDKTFGAYSDQTVWKEPFERDIRAMYEKFGDRLEDIFCANIERKGLRGVVKHYRGLISSFAESFSGKLRLVFVDGDHSYEAVSNDIETVERYLVPGGWIAFDDAFSSYDGVNRAIQDRIINSGKYELAQQMTRKCFAARRK